MNESRKDRLRAPGIKVRIGGHYVVRLADAKTGRWLANVQWLPRGIVSIELPSTIQMQKLSSRLPPRNRRSGD